MTKRKPSPYQITRGIGAYLDELEAGTVNGKRFVVLGQFDRELGIPNRTDDPEVVEQAIAIINERAREATTSVVRLKRTQRALTLQRELDELIAAQSSNGEAEAFFVEHALAWATDNGISYGAFRAMGVPAPVLKDAGITRGFAP